MPNDRKICLIDDPDEHGTLTKAEAAVLALVDGGPSNLQIAASLCITVGTMKYHLHRVYEKLDVGRRTRPPSDGPSTTTWAAPETCSPHKK